MKLCEFNTDGYCHVCKRSYPGASHDTLRKCTTDNPRPTFRKRLRNFTVALIAHVVNGLPTCSQEEIDGRLAVCKVCELFSNSTCNHKSCGCNIGNQKKFLNKLAWADQHCPDGRW